MPQSQNNELFMVNFALGFGYVFFLPKWNVGEGNKEERCCMVWCVCLYTSNCSLSYVMQSLNAKLIPCITWDGPTKGVQIHALLWTEKSKLTKRNKYQYIFLN